MNVLLIGGGGREHSIATALAKSSLLSKLYCSPGNAGIDDIAESVILNISGKQEVLDFCLSNKIGIVFVGPEVQLVEGLVDFLEDEGIFAFGPSKIASQLEGSKSFTKEICKEYNIPTAKYKSFNKLNKALQYIENHHFPLVIKVDGLAAGKGVIIAEEKEVAISTINEMFSGKYGDAGKKVVIEEFLEGEEASFFIISDGKDFLPLTTAQDHKRIGEMDVGPNTGGMGAYSPAPIMNKNLCDETVEKIIKPTLLAMKKLGSPYKGVLYAGLMITKDGPKLIEYNVRFGDPECQVIIPRLRNDLLELIIQVKNQSLCDVTLKWDPNFAITIVMSSEGYPGYYENGYEIIGLEKASNVNNVEIYHAGTKKNKNKIITNGGRVLNINGYGKTLKMAKDNAMEAVELINWTGCYYRKDIGWRALEKKRDE